MIEQYMLLEKEVNKLRNRYELSKIVGDDYFEPGMMEYLDQSYGELSPDGTQLVLRFEARGTRYEGRTERIEDVSVGNPLVLARDKGNAFNHNNFMILDETGRNLGNMPAELCNAIAPLYDRGELVFDECNVSFVEPISKRSRYAKQAVLFVEIKASVHNK